MKNLKSVPDYQTKSDASEGPLEKNAIELDHIAIAVSDLEGAIAWCQDALGMKCVERRTTEGKRTSMDSAVMVAGPITFVLVKGNEPDSQVSRYVEKHGPGIQHIAIRVKDAEGTVEALSNRGASAATTIIGNADIRQSFLMRSEKTGVMIEIIEKSPDGKFTDENIEEMYLQIEEKKVY